MIGRFVPHLLQRRRHERACVVRMRRDDDDDATTTTRRRQTWIRSVDECEVRVKSYLVRVGIRVLFSSS